MAADANTDGDENCDDASSPITRAYETKLDQDFLYYLDEAHRVFEKASLKQKDKSLVTSWFNRLIGEPSQTVDKKKLRNIYLVELLLQLLNGTLEDVFKENPPEGQLVPVDEAFSSYKRKRGMSADEMLNSELDPCDLKHISEDNRVYCACKAMPDDGGACGFLAVSYGGGDAVWLSATGEQIELEERNDLTVKYTVSGDEDCNIYVENPEASFLRFEQDPSRRDKLRCFYQEILDAIDKELKLIRKQPGWFAGIQHPAVKNLANKILNSIKPGQTGKTMDVHDLNPILYALKLKIQCKLEDESLAGENLPTEFNQDAKLVNMGKRIYPVDDQEIWCEAFKLDITEFSLNQLVQNYPKCLVDAFVTLLNKQKGVILSQEQRSYEMLIVEVQKELYKLIRQDQQAYEAAYDEYRNLAKIRDSIGHNENNLSRQLEQSREAVAEMEFKLKLCDDDREQIKALMREIKIVDDALSVILKEKEEVEEIIKSVNDKLRSLSNTDRKGNIKSNVSTSANYLNKLQSLIEQQEVQINWLQHKKFLREMQTKNH
ncbi:uncharacterized protein LOC106665143 [Cimex lectularius]|uniref:DUF4485 domain-containing protein n=1 Tax=Cimex lectularius TaxID=79782 RepID=A0A8I6RNF5_CIMLE|nr:uncharacterized protein LOC106665143 [Cimex lectularius]